MANKDLQRFRCEGQPKREGVMSRYNFDGQGGFMIDPNLPEGVKQSDIDRTVGETFDPDKLGDQVLILQKRIENIKTLCGYLNGHHPPACNGWTQRVKQITFEDYNCDCWIGDILHEIEMSEDFI